MKIVVDAYGNDLGPSQPVEASVKAVKMYDDVNIVLCGKEEELNNLLSNYDYDKTRIEVVAAEEIISNEEVPTEAVKTKSNSSLVKAFETLKQNEEVVGLVSCGSTGAVLTAAFLKLGRMKGISRPALCPVLPAKNGAKVMLIDSGANIDCKPINLCHFALLASCYAKTLFNIENPKVALLNIGTEDKKGNEFCHECFAELKKMPINFVGNMEARDFLSGEYDIVVADGFYGNILLKSVEGTASFVLSSLKKEIKKSFLSKIGALFMKKSFKNLKSSFNYNNYGGAAFLGVKKLVVKGHGASDSLAFLKSIEQVRTLHLNKFCETMEQELNSLGEKTNG
ncbi:MAG: phosphate acyltransferase PlsX [Clostridia bacterium]|nr:phosphate acyltransferase PlsX [Clostridia bacterium]